MDVEPFRELPDDYVVTSGMRTALPFFQAMFEPSDTVLFRPIEIWEEKSGKKNQVAFDEVCHRPAQTLPLCLTIGHFEQIADEKRLNIFFGVCPRFGDNSKFDLAWQIRTVRSLWTDIDHISVDEAQARIAKSGLPPPTALVNSGNGVHAYWRLDEPYLIDDVGSPPPVLKEWVKTPGGKNKPRPYVVEDGDRVYLDQRRSISRLSLKAERGQNIVAGIAQILGGDNTQDLSRLLRVPGTFNRKDQRNGREPKLTELVECDQSRRYPLTAFERFAISSPETTRAKNIGAIPLPPVRKASASTVEQLTAAITRCMCAQPGQRSEADFALCCLAVRKGIAKEEVWSQVANVGKFAERGRTYFDRTWENAEFETRCKLLEDAEKDLNKKRPPNNSTSVDGSREERPSFDGPDIHDRPTIEVIPAIMPIGDTLRQVTDVLLGTKESFTRSDQLVVVNNSQITSILTSNELKGLLSQYVEFFFVDKEKGEFRPLPPDLGNTWLCNHVERGRLPAIKLFTNNPVYTSDWRLVAPGYDASSGIYYAGPVVGPRTGTKHLDTFLRDFCFHSPADRSNYLGMLLTTILMPHFIGSKPAVIFNGNQPGLGKSILAQGIAILRDGKSVETASYNPNDEEFEKRIGAIVRFGRTTIIIDNAKSNGRNPRIESACLERCITDAELSFRLLGHSASIRVENSHIFCITANSPDISRDLVTRSVAISLFHEGDPTRRTFSMPDPETYALTYRPELLGELMGMVDRWLSVGRPLAEIHSRFNKRGWANIVGGILAANGEPDFLSNAAEAAEGLDDIRRDFCELVSVMAQHTQGVWTPSEMSELALEHKLLEECLGTKSSRSQSTRMGILAGRYVNESFGISGHRKATFRKADGKDGSVYVVYVADSAER
jgi:hypothetical protein